MASSNLVQLIKHIAMDAVAAAKPCDYRIGTVMNVEPLKIKVSNSFILEEDFVQLSRNVTNYKTNIVIDGITRNCQIENKLKKDERVVMIRKAGGQEYVILDRVVSE